MEKVLFATGNPAKIKRYVVGLAKRGIEAVTLKDLGIIANVEETGSTAIENAIIKATEYHKRSGLTTIAIDDCLFIEGLSDDEQPKDLVRRVNGKLLSDQEMIEHYSKIATKLGGRANAYFLHGIAICKDNGTKTLESRQERIFVDKPSPILNEGYPLGSINLVPKYNKYRVELTSEELEELEQDDYKEIFDFIIDNV